MVYIQLNLKQMYDTFLKVEKIFSKNKNVNTYSTCMFTVVLNKFANAQKIICAFVKLDLNVLFIKQS